MCKNFLCENLAAANRAKTACFLNNLLGVFTLRKTGAGKEFAKSPGLDDHFSSAKLANNIGFLSASNKKGASIVDAMLQRVEKIKAEAEIVLKKIKLIEDEMGK